MRGRGRPGALLVLRVTESILLSLLLAISVTTGFGRSGQELGDQPLPILQPSIHTSAIAKLAALSRAAGNLGFAFPAARELVFGGLLRDSPSLTAFEENSPFVYAAGVISGSGGNPKIGNGPGETPRLLRRIIFLRPSALVVDDEVFASGSSERVAWRLYSQEMPRVTGRKVAISEGKIKLSCETLLPRRISSRLGPRPTAGTVSGRYVVEITPPENSQPTRFLNVFSVGEPGRVGPAVYSTIASKNGDLLLSVSSQGRVFHLELPSLASGPGRIAVTLVGGEPQLVYRPFASGVLPHDPEGIRLLAQWDDDYRGKKPPLWDIGKASSELKEVVENGAVKQGRAVDLCSGTGTDAVFLASRGFDVTAIDISPTALTQAQQKAQTAGVSVRWVLADVLAPPSLEPFDFLYDRGCYHVVRNQNRDAYLETLHRLSRPRSKFLLLAARRDDESMRGSSEGVTEQELRFDFQALFEVLWLHENRLEANRPGGLGPPGWAALLLRKTESGPEGR